MTYTSCYQCKSPPVFGNSVGNGKYPDEADRVNGAPNNTGRFRFRNRVLVKSYTELIRSSSFLRK